MKILVTGSAGFIGFHVSKALLARGDEVVGLDNFNEYYDPKLKEARNAILEKEKGYTLIRGDIRNREDIAQAMKGVDRVLHLAAMAGVRYSIEHPEDFWAGFRSRFQILEIEAGRHDPDISLRNAQARGHGRGRACGTQSPSA